MSDNEEGRQTNMISIYKRTTMLTRVVKETSRAILRRRDSLPKKPFRVPLRNKPTIAQKESEEPSSPYIPLAERMYKIANEIPDRFRIKPKQAPLPPPKKRLTKPASPVLATSHRSRVNNPNSKKKITPFKARPINPKVMNSRGDLGVPKIKKKPVTEVVEFNLSKPNNKDKNKKQTKIIQNHDFGGRIPPGKKFTIPEPFNFESSRFAAKRMQEFERKTKQEIEELERARKFKALPLPKIKPRHQQQTSNQVEFRRLTKPKPFNFLSEQRVEHHRRLMQSKIDEEARKAKEQKAAFKALPMPKYKVQPIYKSSKSPTKFEPLNLGLEERVQKRLMFDTYIIDKMEQEEKRRKVEEELKRKQEQERIKHQYRLNAFKAKPMPKYNFFKPQPSDKHLTIPETPVFAKKKNNSIKAKKDGSEILHYEDNNENYENDANEEQEY